MLITNCQKIDKIRKTPLYILIVALLSLLSVTVFASASGANEILTPEEHLWLANNQTRIVLAVETGYAPFVFLNDQGQPAGLAQDFIHLIEEKIGASFQKRQFSSLNDIFEKVREGKVHIVNAVTKTPARLEFLAFTSPFISVPNVILVRKDRNGTMNEENLAGLNVALVKSYAITEDLINKKLGFTPNLVMDDLTALLNVSFGRSDAAVIDLATASYLIYQKGITNLRVAGESTLHVHLAIGTHINEPVLNSILQKGLGAITDIEREEIRNRWINTTGQSILSDWRLWLILGVMIFSIMAVITIISIWNRMLRRQVRERTAELEQERVLLEQRVVERTADLARSETQLRATLENTPNVAVQWYDDAGRITYWNSASEKLFGWKVEDALGKTLDKLIFTAAAAAEFYRILIQVKESGYPYGPFETEVHTRDGQQGWSLSTVFAIPMEQGQMGFVCMYVDITKRKLIEESLRSSEEKLRSLYELAPLGITLTDMAGRYIEFNEAFRAICGYSVDELRALDYWELTPKEFEQEEMLQLGLLERLGCYGPYEKQYRRKDGSLISINLNGRLVVGSDGQRYIWSIVEDISKRKQSEAKLQLAASVFSHAREGIMITDASSTIIEVNDTFSLITGYSREEVLGKNPRIFQSGRHSAEFYKVMWQELMENNHWTGEIWNRRKNGEVYAEILTISAVRDTTGRTQHYVALFTDITPMKEYAQQLEHIAHYDALTTLPNRVLLADRLQQAILQTERRKYALAVIYLDLDGFKAINDTHGHETGDELLITVSQRMKEALREGDTLARIGGDEFVAVLVDLEQIADCEPVLSRLLETASAPVLVDDIKLHVSASIGVTFYPQDNVDADHLIRHADQAMYVAKQSGKNRYHLFDVQHDASIKTQGELLDRIHLAHQRNEFVLYYQPKVNMQTGEVIGAEALIRWQHPKDGLLFPLAFLPIIENLEIGIQIGEWVIDSALSQMEEWHAAGLNIAVSVNIGANQLQRHDFVPKLSALLSKHSQINPSDLELEILETSALENLNDVSHVIRTCREIGVQFALDDFGTGYSSLTYLRHLPVTILKIDQTFVRDMLDDPDDLTIVKSVIGLATAFQRQVIAEGVETIAHGAMLQSIGCQLAQGYGIARPMPAAEILDWVANWKKSAEDWKAVS